MSGPVPDVPNDEAGGRTFYEPSAFPPRSSTGSLAMLAAMRRASSRVNSLAAVASSKTDRYRVPGPIREPPAFRLEYTADEASHHEETGDNCCATLNGVVGCSASRDVKRPATVRHRRPVSTARPTTDGGSGPPVSTVAGPDDGRFLHRGNDLNVLQCTRGPNTNGYGSSGGSAASGGSVLSGGSGASRGVPATRRPSPSAQAERRRTNCATNARTCRLASRTLKAPPIRASGSVSSRQRAGSGGPSQARKNNAKKPWGS